MTALCQITIVPDWTRILPEVYCSEPWVRSGQDWHAFNGDLCYVFDDEWRDLVSLVRSDEGNLAAARYAANLCLRNVRWLLYRHHIAAITKLANWPADWPGWPHSHAQAHRKYWRERSQVVHELATPTTQHRFGKGKP